MTNRPLFKIILAILIVLTAVILVYTVCFKSVVLIEDQAFSILYPKQAKTDFLKTLAKQFYNFRVITLTAEELEDSELLIQKLAKYSDVNCLVLSPVASASVKFNQLNLKETFEKTSIIALGSMESELFDTCLKEDKSLLKNAAPEEQDFVGKDEIHRQNFDYEDFAVDYRYLGAVEKSKVKSIVAPDLCLSVLPLLKLEKDALPQVGSLAYGNYEVK